MSIDYQVKYLKYKEKYKSLKNKYLLKQKGGYTPDGFVVKYICPIFNPILPDSTCFPTNPEEIKSTLSTIANNNIRILIYADNLTSNTLPYNHGAKQQAQQQIKELISKVKNKVLQYKNTSDAEIMVDLLNSISVILNERQNKNKEELIVHYQKQVKTLSQEVQDDKKEQLQLQINELEEKIKANNIKINIITDTISENSDDEQTFKDVSELKKQINDYEEIINNNKKLIKELKQLNKINNI